PYPSFTAVCLLPARCAPATLASLKRVLKAAGLKTMEMTPKAHDDQMAVIQAIPHFKSLLMGELLQSLGVDLQAVSKTFTPTYELEFNVIGRFLDDEPELYMPIIFRNPAAPAILRRLKRLLDGYIRIADRRDLPAASRRYRRLKRHFAPFAKRARSHSEACIATLSKLSR
ncbi:MAG TPA: prephenate dehydrogenase/arogenate dehydrogenase family protein, partial [Candidatus Peribacteria bacterium]|nr:prephenate dehydrogenase/arogenate dehydrogenase family protein [Candidatus Peribacteria bacterium]